MAWTIHRGPGGKELQPALLCDLVQQGGGAVPKERAALQNLPIFLVQRQNRHLQTVLFDTE